MFHTYKKKSHMLHTIEEDIYKNTEMGLTWGSDQAFSISSFSMEPSSSAQPPAELMISHDKHFALHGEIWLLVVVFTFAVFFVYILFFPRLRCCRNRESEASDSGNNIPRRRNCPLMSLRKRKTIDEDEEDALKELARRINEKFPF